MREIQMEILTEDGLKEWDRLKGDSLDLSNSNVVIIEALEGSQTVTIGEKEKQTEFRSSQDITSFCSSAPSNDFKWLLGIEWLEAGK